MPTVTKSKTTKRFKIDVETIEPDTKEVLTATVEITPDDLGKPSGQELRTWKELMAPEDFKAMTEQGDDFFLSGDLSGKIDTLFIILFAKIKTKVGARIRPHITVDDFDFDMESMGEFFDSLKSDS